MTTFDAASAAVIIEAQFPALRPADVSYLGEGYDSTAFDVNGRWVFRFPKRDDVEAQLLTEWRILPRLLATSPLPLPDFRFRGRPSPAFPRHFGGYPKLPGVPAMGVDPRAIPVSAAASIGRFLAWLHAWPAHEARRLDVPLHDRGTLVEETAEEALRDLEQARMIDPSWPIDEWRTMVADLPSSLEPESAVVVHGDLAAEHVLFDTSADAFAGVIDWSEVAVGDPAIDLAALFHWGDRTLADAALAAYRSGIDETLRRRARFFAACRGAGDIVFGADTGRRAYIDGGVRALRFCLQHVR